jgi:hypothetical protein
MKQFLLLQRGKARDDFSRPAIAAAGPSSPKGLRLDFSDIDQPALG